MTTINEKEFNKKYLDTIVLTCFKECVRDFSHKSNSQKITYNESMCTKNCTKRYIEMAE